MPKQHQYFCYKYSLNYAASFVILMCDKYSEPVRVIKVTAIDVLTYRN